jgi:hypothetical protein
MHSSVADQKQGEGHGGNDHGGHHDEKFDIRVNGEAVVWRNETISYDDVVKLAFPNGPFGGEIRYSVSWTKPNGEEGSLRPGHSVHVVDGMMFDVANTYKS